MAELAEMSGEIFPQFIMSGEKMASIYSIEAKERLDRARTVIMVRMLCRE